jgi:hypothetical protein
MPSGIQGSLHLDRVPDNHGMSQEIQTGRLMALPFLVLLAHNALACKEEQLAQIMQFLAFVELGTHVMTQGALFQRAPHKNCLDQPPILLKEPGALALAGVCLPSTEEERSGDLPTFE